MALVKGTNCGFVAASPDGDPVGLGFPSSTGDGFALKDTSPAGNKIITEIGYWQGSSVNPSRAFNVGIYEDDGGAPGALIAVQSSGNSTVETSAQWNKYTGLSIPIDPETVYWIGLGIEGGPGANYFDIAFDAGEIYHYEDTADEVLSDPFDSDGSTSALFGIYAKYEAVPSILPLIGSRMGGGCNPMTG